MNTVLALFRRAWPGHIPLCLLAVALLASWPVTPARAATLDPAVVPLLKRSFVHGREYFVLRSGRAKLIVQADQADLAPAFLYLLFDAQDNQQSARKEQAFNFGDGQGFVNSAVEVLLGGFPFTALGHQTQTRWGLCEGIPAAEAVWWAGGLRVTERLLALGGDGVFLRRVEVTAVNLGGAETVRLRLSLPTGRGALRDGWLVQDLPGCRVALSAAGSRPVQTIPELGQLEVGPLVVAPGESVSVDTLLLVQIPPAIQADASWPPLKLEPALRTTAAGWEMVSSITTSDATVQEILDRARFGLPGMVADNGVMDAGIFEYGRQWVRDTSNTLLGLVHAGHFELARRGFVQILEHMVNAEGNAMIAGGFDDPDREQFDQMGELLHALKAYRDWTGDESLLREHRGKLVALIERPLRPEFRDPMTGMVHNRREFWERTLEDAFELAYQTYVVLGLRDAAALAEPLGASDRAERWRIEADRIETAMLRHPTRALVEAGRLIKRRSVTGERVRTIRFPAYAPDVPLKTEQMNLAEPDATMALPVAFRLVDPQSALARNTLDELEKLWDARWFGGGYERYHSSGQCDQPGPWTFATCFILRAQHEAGQFDRSRRTLEWLHTVQGGRTGAWFEEIPLVRSQAPTAGIIPWTSGEICLFVVRHLLGARFEDQRLVLQPALYPGSPPVKADLRYRQGRLRLELDGSGPIREARVHGAKLEPDAAGAIRLPADFQTGTLVLRTRRH